MMATIRMMAIIRAVMIRNTVMCGRKIFLRTVSFPQDSGLRVFRKTVIHIQAKRSGLRSESTTIRRFSRKRRITQLSIRIISWQISPRMSGRCLRSPLREKAIMRGRRHRPSRLCRWTSALRQQEQKARRHPGTAH